MNRGSQVELAYSEISLILAMTFGLLGSATFGCLLLLVRETVDNDRRLTSIDVLSPVPTLAIVLAFIVLIFSLAHPTSAILALHEAQPALFGVCALLLLALGAAAAYYAISALAGKVKSPMRSALFLVMGVAGIAFVLLASLMHSLASVASWSGLLVFAAILGTSVVAGISLSSAMIESAELPLSSHRRTVVAIASLIGLVAGGMGFVCQVVRSTEWFAGISLGSCFVEAVSTNVAVGLFCLVASALFCVLGVRSKDKGYYSVISVASSIVALFCLFIVLYTAVPW